MIEISKQLSFFNVNSAHMCKVMYTNLINSTKKLIRFQGKLHLCLYYHGSWSRVRVKPPTGGGEGGDKSGLSVV